MPPKAKRHKVLKHVDNLTELQLELLVGLLDGSRVLLTIDNKRYAVQSKPDGWELCCLDAGSVPHTVSRDFQCSCKDFTCRKHDCKHITAIKGLV